MSGFLTLLAVVLIATASVYASKWGLILILNSIGSHYMNKFSKNDDKLKRDKDVSK